MCSTRNTKIFSTLATQERTERTEYIIDDTLTKKYLHVCIKTIDDGPVHNCGRCYKCLRTLAAIDILGKLPEYETIFDQSYYKTHKAAILCEISRIPGGRSLFRGYPEFRKAKRVSNTEDGLFVECKILPIITGLYAGQRIAEPHQEKNQEILKNERIAEWE